MFLPKGINWIHFSSTWIQASLQISILELHVSYSVKNLNFLVTLCECTSLEFLKIGKTKEQKFDFFYNDDSDFLPIEMI